MNAVCTKKTWRVTYVSLARFGKVCGFLVLPLLLSLVLLTGCDDDDDDNGETTLGATLSGAQEVPAVTTNGTGTASLSLQNNDTSLDYTLTYANVSPPTQAHIHIGAAGTNGPIVLFLCSNLAPPQNVPVPQACPAPPATITGTLTAANLIPRPEVNINTFADAVAALLAGNAYANVHSMPFPAGEIRGQLDEDE